MTELDKDKRIAQLEQLLGSDIHHPYKLKVI